MKFGIISDIHGNLPALEAVLSELNQTVDKIICCGDIIGIGGSPNEVITAVQNNCEYIIKGNHDMYPFKGTLSSTVGQVEKQVFFDETTEAQQSWLYKLPSYLQVPEHELLIAHSKPTKSESLGMKNGNAGVPPRDYTACISTIDTASYVTLGHTHTQHKLDGAKFGHNVILINPGSVGGVYQESAQYAILDTEDDSVQTLSVPYDTEARDDRIRELEQTYNVSLL